jgi:hypothetical protein
MSYTLKDGQPGENTCWSRYRKRNTAVLKKLGYYSGEIHGIFDIATKNAYESFCGIENFEERMLEGNYVDKKVLEFLIDKSSTL